MQQPTSLYIIGAKCTGKTTLLHALKGALSLKYPSLHMRSITEVARKVLQDHQFSPEDIIYSPERALQLQKLILVAQYEEESKITTVPILCDRSGVDPIVYAVEYGPSQAQEILESLSQWHYLRDRMRQSLVILCPPHHEWLVDDGTRLMARSLAEWDNMHLTFLQVLETNGIEFQIIPKGMLDLETRIEFVLHLWSNFAWNRYFDCI